MACAVPRRSPRPAPSAGSQRVSRRRSWGCESAAPAWRCDPGADHLHAVNQNDHALEVDLHRSQRNQAAGAADALQAGDDERHRGRAIFGVLTVAAPEDVLVMLETQAALGDDAPGRFGGVAKRGGAPRPSGPVPTSTTRLPSWCRTASPGRRTAISSLAARYAASCVSAQKRLCCRAPTRVHASPTSSERRASGTHSEIWSAM